MANGGSRGWVRAFGAGLVLAAGAMAGGGGVLGSQDAGVGRTERTITALDVDDAWVALDLTDPDLVVRFDHSFGPIDYAHVSLTCPNGSGMPLDFWIQFEGQRLGRPAEEIGQRMAMLAARAQPEDRDPCFECHVCPDGLTMCEDRCSDVPNRDDDDADDWRYVCPYGICSTNGNDPGDWMNDDGEHPDWDAAWWGDFADGSGSSSGGGDEPDSWAAGTPGFGDGNGGGSDGSDGGGGGGSGSGGSGGGGFASGGGGNW